MSGGVPTRFSMANTLPKLKKSSSWMISSVSKEEVFSHSRPLALNRTKQILRCNNRANELQLPRRWNQRKHWAKWQQFGTKRDCLHIFDSNLNFNTEYARSFGDRELLAFSSKANGKTEKKNTFSAVEDFTLLWWHSGTQKRVGRTKQKDQIDNETRLFWKSIVKTKHQSLTSLASIQLIPGADRVVRHICIRCIHQAPLNGVLS